MRNKDPALEEFDPELVKEFKRRVLNPYSRQLLASLREFAASKSELAPAPGFPRIDTVSTRHTDRQ